MSSLAGSGQAPNYFVRLFASVRQSLAQLARPESHSRRAEAARTAARHGLLLATVLGTIIIVLMYVLDVPEIKLMPPRGTASLWPAQILTDFGRAAFVLWLLAGILFAVALVSPCVNRTSRLLLAGFATRLQFLFLAVAVPLLAGELVKWIVGRGRPFVGGEANAFNFVHFAGTQAYASFPSAHSITAFALAFAVSAVWPRARAAMTIYAILIGASRLVLLAHHPSDVVAGALIGVIGAMFVRYWFAARRLGFAIHRGGVITPLAGPSFSRLKGVAREAFAP